MPNLRFLTLNPGHFHAALVQKEMYAGVDPRVQVYSPLDADLVAHLQRLAGFNARPHQPTAWHAEVHAGPDSLKRLVRDRAGDVVVIAGRNAPKIDAIAAAVSAGLHVLADKPWVIVPEDLPKLKAVLDEADRRCVIAYDIMTERFEITSILQRELLQDRGIVGDLVPGTKENPGVYMESVHFLKKNVAGVPLRRPAWFFDIHQQGEGLADVGPHLVDLVMWMLYPQQTIDAGADLVLDAAKRWPTMIDRAGFQHITGLGEFPSSLAEPLQGEALPYYCNTQVEYRIRGIHVKFDVLWGFEAEPGAGDTHLAVIQGSQARVEVRQGREQNFKAELYVVAQQASDHSRVAAALRERIAALTPRYPGLAVVDQEQRFQVTIPDVYRTGHEAHFGEVTQQFLRYVRKEQALPTWEKPNMLAKYFVTTEGVALSRRA